MGLVQQLVERPDGMSNSPVAKQQDKEQSDDEKRHYNIGQLVVILQDVTFRAHEGKAPGGTWHGLIADMAMDAVDGDDHVALFTLCHLMAESYNTGLLAWIGIVEDGLGEEA